jgi:mitochondrial fission protein ELM1
MNHEADTEDFGDVDKMLGSLETMMNTPANLKHMCGRCNQPVEGDATKALNKIFHVKICFPDRFPFSNFDIVVLSFRTGSMFCMSKL